MNNGYVGESFGLNSQIFTLTSAASTGRPIKVDDCDKVTCLISIGATGDGVTIIGGLHSTITITQGSSAETATAAGMATAVIKTQIGSTAANIVQRAHSLIIACASGKNGGNVGETLVLNGVTLTVGATDAAFSSNVLSSVGQFGSSALSTVANSMDLATHGLAGLINSTWGSSVFPNGGLGSVFRATTLSTLLVKVELKDELAASSGLTVVCGTGFTPSYLSAQAKLEFPVSLLDSTSKYITANLTTVDANVGCNITYIKQGMRYKPVFSGNSAKYEGTTA